MTTTNLDNQAVMYMLQEMLERMVRTESKVSVLLTTNGVDSFGRPIRKPA